MSRLFKFTFLIVLIFVFAVSPVMAQDDVVPDGESIVVQIEDTLTFWDVFNVLSNLGLLIAIVVIGVAIRKTPPAQLDTDVAKHIDSLQQDRDFMDPIERAYANSNEILKDGFKVFGDVLMTVAKYTNSNTLREVGEFVDDVTVPGAPDLSATPDGSLLLREGDRSRFGLDDEPPVEDDDTAFNIVAEGGDNE